MRVACPTLIYPCEFLNFSASRSSLDLAGRKAIVEIEGQTRWTWTNMQGGLGEEPRHGGRSGSAWGSPRSFQTMGDLVDAIGLPKEKLCTHCWTGAATSIPLG